MRGHLPKPLDGGAVCAPVYPFDQPVAWWIAGRAKHLALIARSVELAEPHRELLGPLLHRLQAWSRFRAVLLALLYVGALATAVSLAATVVPHLAHLSPALARLATITGASTTVLAGLILVTTRVLGTLELDILGLLAVAGKR
jgi:hypothetical protein